MASLDTTSWRLIRQAAQGEPNDRDEFARRYLPAARAFFGARWRRTPMAVEVEDAAQEVFVECFRDEGVLAKADPERKGGFRALFFGVLRNVAGRHEKRARLRQRRTPLPLAADGGTSRQDTLSTVQDRAWAQRVMADAARRQLELANLAGAAAVRRCELLRLRFQDGLPIRDIARLWKVDADGLHHEYATARKEFAMALREVVGRLAEPGTVDELLARVMAALG